MRCRRAGGARLISWAPRSGAGTCWTTSRSAASTNETSCFTNLLEPLDLADAVMTFDAQYAVRANLDWLASGKKPATSL